MIDIVNVINRKIEISHKKQLFLILLLMASIVCEYFIINTYFPKNNIIPLTTSESVTLDIYIFVYYFVIVTLLGFSFLFRHNHFLFKTIIIGEFLLWVSKIFFVRNYYFTPPGLQIILLPNSVLINYDIVSIFLRIIIIYLLFGKTLSLKILFYIIFVSIVVIELKLNLFSNPFLPIIWQ